MLMEKSIGQNLVDSRQHKIMRPQWRLGYVRRRKLLFSCIVFLSTGLAVIAALITPPLFLATTRLVYDPRPENIATSPQVVADASADAMAIDTQVEVLKSTSIAQRVVSQLALTNDREFNAAPSAGILARLLRKADGSNDRPKEDAVAENVSKRLVVRNLGLSSVIEVGFRSVSPDKAARIANAIASVYVSDQIEIKQQATEKALAALSSRLQELREKADKSDSAVRAFQGTSGLVGLQSATGATALQQQIQALTTQLAAAHAQEAEASARLKTVQSISLTNDTSIDSLNSPVIQALKKQSSDTFANIAQLSSTEGAQHPTVLAERAKLRAIDNQMQAEISRIRSSVESDSRTAHGRTLAIEEALTVSTRALQQANVASVEATQLENQAESDRLVYQAILDRFKQISAQTGMERADARILSIASPPNHPSTPIRRLIVIAGFLFGCAAALLIVSWYEVFRGGIYNEDEIVTLLEVPCLGSIPELRSTLDKRDPDDHRVIDYPIYQQSSVFSEMLRGIAASAALKGRKHVSILVTSALEREGKSTTSIALARTLALSGIRILLIDCDLARRATTVALGEDISAGICELVDGSHTFQQVINLDKKSGMHWIGVSNNLGVAPVGTFASPSMTQLLARARTQYDLVLLDAAPILASSDAQNLARKANQILLTVSWAHTRRSAIAASAKLLSDLGVNVTGAILTRVDVKRQSRMGDGNKYAHFHRYLNYSQ